MSTPLTCNRRKHDEVFPQGHGSSHSCLWLPPPSRNRRLAANRRKASRSSRLGRSDLLPDRPTSSPAMYRSSRSGRLTHTSTLLAALSPSSRRRACMALPSGRPTPGGVVRSRSDTGMGQSGPGDSGEGCGLVSSRCQALAWCITGHAHDESSRHREVSKGGTSHGWRRSAMRSTPRDKHVVRQFKVMALAIALCASLDAARAQGSRNMNTTLSSGWRPRDVRNPDGPPASHHPDCRVCGGRRHRPA